MNWKLFHAICKSWSNFTVDVVGSYGLDFIECEMTARLRRFLEWPKREDDEVTVVGKIVMTKDGRSSVMFSITDRSKNF